MLEQTDYSRVCSEHDPMTKQGDTFQLTNKGVVIDKHLHIMLSDPAQNPNEIVTANFTTWQADKDQSCIVEAEEHSFLRVRSCVDYRREKRISQAQYEQCLKSGDLVPRDPVSAALMKRILQGAANSPFLSLGNRQILVNQSLIDTE